MSMNMIRTMMIGTFAAIWLPLAAAEIEVYTEWQYSISDGKATITGVRQYSFAPLGIGDYYVFEGICADERKAYDIDLKFYLEPEGALAIPSVIGKYPVTDIGASAFLNRWRITSVNIPDGVETIGDRAFEGCRGLKSVTIPCTTKSIGDYAFDGCSSLTYVLVPASVMDIGTGAFGGCSSLANAILPTWCSNDRINTLDSIFCNSRTDMRKSANKTKCWRRICIKFRDCCTATEGVVPLVWKMARTFTGKAVRKASDGQSSAATTGVITIKCGKANSSGTAKVSATITWLDGSKSLYKARPVDVTVEPVTAMLDGLSITFDGASFSGNGDGIERVETAQIGGTVASGTFRLADDFDFPAQGELQYGLLPKAEPFTTAGRAWKFAKSSIVRLATNAETGTPEIMVNREGGKTNTSALKLSYSAKTGIFKGSFYVYVLKTGAKTQLVRHLVNVNGIVVNGKGSGQATSKKPVGGPWSVRID